MFKSSLVYLLSTIISSAIPFCILPILSRTLTQEQYGKIAMFELTLSIFSIFCGLNSQNVMARNFFDKGFSLEDVRRFNGACFIILFISFILLLFSFLLFGDVFSGFLGINQNWILFGLIASLFSFFYQVRLSQWQIRDLYFKHFFLKIIFSIFSVFFSLLLILYFRIGAEGRIYGILIAYLLVGFFSLISILKNKIFSYAKLEVLYIKQALTYCIPLVFHFSGFFLLFSIDRYILNKQMGLASVGVYAIAFQIAGALKLIFQSLNRAYTPVLFRILSQEDLNSPAIYSLVKKTYFCFFLLLIVAFIGYFISPPVIVFIVGQKFKEAGSIIGFLVLGNIFIGMYFIVVAYVFFSKKTYFLIFTTMTSGIVNIYLMLYLIPTEGIRGAAISFFISNMYLFFSTWIVSFFAYRVPWFRVLQRRFIRE